MVGAPDPDVKPKLPRPSRKNSRFSGKKRLKRVRFTCCSSTSTCAKSVLYVASRVRLLVIPYFTSTPTSPSRSFDVGDAATRSVRSPPIAYGFTSTLRLLPGTSTPWSVAAWETRQIPAITLLPRAAEMGRAVRYEASLRRRMIRRS
jgi:hypothetical protein